MKKVSLLIIVLAMMASYGLNAQIAITTDGSNADASAMLDVKSNDKGVLMPRLSQTEIEVISNPANGLMVFNTDDNRFYFYDAIAEEWKELAVGAGTIAPVESSSVSCMDILNNNPASPDGLYWIDPDGSGDVQPFEVYCDMTTDGGGWTLLSEYEESTATINKIYDDPDKYQGFIEDNIESLELRIEVATTAGRTYKLFSKNIGTENLDTYGNTRYIAEVKPSWTDTYAGSDWGFSPVLSRSVCTFHACASGDPSGYYQNNIMSEAHRTITASDGNRFVACSNTFFNNENAYCGSLVLTPNTVQSRGCNYSNSGFIVAGPEGQSTQSYLGIMNGISTIKFWSRN